MFFQPCHSWPHGLLGASQGRCVSCAVSSLLRHVGVMTSETLARAGALGRLVVLEVRAGPKGRGLAGPGRSLVSMVLTLKAYRGCTPKRNRRISTIPAGRTDAGLVDVSAVDTGPRRSESGVLAAQPGAPVTGPPHRSLPAACAGSGGQGSASAPPRVGPSWLELACSTRVGIYWPRVVRTARRPQPPKVHPTLVQ